jgi:hypothetical protein
MSAYFGMSGTMALVTIHLQYVLLLHTADLIRPDLRVRPDLVTRRRPAHLGRDVEKDIQSTDQVIIRR